MSTMTAPTHQPPATAPAGRSPWVLVLVAVVALLVGFAGGAWVATAVDDEPVELAASGTELTAADKQVVDAVRRYQGAWLAADAEAVAASFAPDGILVWQGQELRADDGGVASFVERIDWSVNMAVSEVVLVDERTAIYTHTVFGWQYVDVVEVTEDDNPLVRRHAMIAEIDSPVNVLAPEG